MSDYYIATTGNDTTGAGTLASPWLTLAKAITACANTETDTVHLASGTYAFVTQVLKSITIIGNSYEDTFLDGSGANVNWNSLAVTTCNIKNLTFKNATGTNGDRSMFTNYTGSASSTYNFENCRFTDLTTGSNPPLFGYWFGSSDMGIMNFRACLFDDIKRSTSVGALTGIISSSFGTFNFVNCTYYNDGALSSSLVTITFKSGTQITTLNNCIFFNDASISGDTNVFDIAPSGATGENNLIEGFTDLPSTLTNTISVDPLFVDAVGGNFNLRASSPCIDGGVVV